MITAMRNGDEATPSGSEHMIGDPEGGRRGRRVCVWAETWHGADVGVLGGGLEQFQVTLGCMACKELFSLKPSQFSADQIQLECTLLLLCYHLATPAVMIIRSALRLRRGMHRDHLSHTRQNTPLTVPSHSGRLALSKVNLLPHPTRASSSLDTSSTPIDDNNININTPLAVPQFVNTTDSAPQLAALDASRTVAINDPNHPVALDYAFFNHQKSRLSPLGSSLAPHYRPHELLTNPPSPADITLELLIASQTHLGHATSLWHPANARYIFGVRDGIHIIAPDTTASHLRRACKIVSGVTERGGLVLFVGTREGHARAVVKAAQLAGGCHLFTKWIPGSITNGQQILGRCAKKVVDEHDQDVEGFEDQLGAKAAIQPDLVVCLNPLENYVLLHECGLNNIPTVGICDTDANPTWVTYPIPANDDSLRAVQVIAGVLGRAGEQGLAKRKSAASQGIVTYMPRHGLTEPTRATFTRKPFSSTRSQRQRPDVTATPDFPEDHVGQSVEEFEADQKLLNEADAALFGSSEKDPSPEVPAAEEEEVVAEEQGEKETASHFSAVDPSLTDENYSNPPLDEYDEAADLAQFGGGLVDENSVGGTEGEGESERNLSILGQIDDAAEELEEEQQDTKGKT